MRMPAKDVWAKGLPVFSRIIHDYTLGAHPVGLLDLYYEKPLPLRPKLPTLVVRGTQLRFTPRYWFQYRQICRTLILLDGYDRSLVRFMKSFVDRYADERNALRRLAHALYVLTYRSKESHPIDQEIDEAKTLLRPEGRYELDQDFCKWDHNTQSGQKRLWAALRDYFKHKELRSCIQETFSWPTEHFHLSQLELPGDIWNDVFNKKLIYRLAQVAGVQTHIGKGNSVKNSPMLARDIFDRILTFDSDTPFYPEQLDVSFDFAPRMCDQGLCDICVFGRNEAIQFCSKPGTGKLCPVLIISAGYRRRCHVQTCPVITGTGMGLCEGGTF